MVVESIPTVTTEAAPHPFFKDVLCGSERWFPMVQSILEDVREEFKAETLMPIARHTLEDKIPPYQLALLRAPWSNTLVGKVLGAKVRYPIVSQRIPQLWNPRGKLDVIDLDKDVFLFRFDLQSDLD